ncbi:hypothetical protein BH20BAC1_BH20BAC1_25680 [soil metagenome]
MVFKKYMKYFYFIATNWNPVLALVTMIHEIQGEKKYNIDTVDLVTLSNLTLKDENLEHATRYQAANYYLLQKAFGFLQGNKVSGNFVDFGCGKGRAMVVAAYSGFKEIIGIDFAKDLCDAAEQNIEKIREKFPGVNFTVLWNDAVNYAIDEGDKVFFFFNPFDESIMLQVAKNILKSLRDHPRQAYVIYMNPVHDDIFLSAGFEQVFYIKKLTYLELSIFYLDAMEN